ncbi:hypothetical protein ACHAWF_004344 [Thalassiosira exigua]
MSTTRLAAKRRKTAPVDGHGSGGGGGDGVLGILDLPNDALAKVGELLPKTSAGLLAVALTAPPSSWRRGGWKGRPSAAGSAVLSAVSSGVGGGHGWEVLDFADVNDRGSESDESGNEERGKPRSRKDAARTSPCSKLNDDDVGALLTCIDAAHKVQRLKLAGCVKVNGRGLEPLCGSLVLEQLDLCLVEEHMNPNITPLPKISSSKVIPILRSIIQKEGNILKHLQLPLKWETDGNSNLETFITEYSDVLDRRLIYCSHCRYIHTGVLLRPRLPWFSGYCFGMQSFTCYKCLKSRCLQSLGSDGCDTCHKYYCVGCQPDKYPENCCDGSGCQSVNCKKCLYSMECDDCEKEYLYCDNCPAPSYCACQKCTKTQRRCFECIAYSQCESCKKQLCNDCVLDCGICDNRGCGECSVQMISCKCREANCVECTGEYCVRQCDLCKCNYCPDCLAQALYDEVVVCSRCEEISRDIRDGKWALNGM